MRYLLTLLLATTLFFACRPATYTPRPRGFARIDTPQHAYKLFDSAGFPYRFEMPAYGYINRSQDMNQMKGENPYWVNIELPQFAGRIYLSYKRISARQPLDTLLHDAYEMSYAHDVRADYINAPTFTNKYGVQGMLYEVGGNAASAYQFFATDTVKHFLRGALYFDVTPNSDSMAPVIHFLKQDLNHMLGTLQWKDQ